MTSDEVLKQMIEELAKMYTCIGSQSYGRLCNHPLCGLVNRARKYCESS